MTNLLTSIAREFGDTGTEDRVIRGVEDLNEDELRAIGHLQETLGVKAAVASVIHGATFEVPDATAFHNEVEREADDLVNGDGQ